MNILVDSFPLSVKIGGFEVGINSCFKASILFSEILRDKKLEENERINKALFLYYPILSNTTDDSSEEDKLMFLHIKDNLQEAIDKMLWFYRCGKEAEEGQQETTLTAKEVFSYEHDAELIYSAFLGQYGIDLSKEADLHWWKFKAMFSGLKDDNELYKRISIRATDITKVGKEQQEYYRKMKKIYAIPHNEEEIKQNSEVAALFR